MTAKYSGKIVWKGAPAQPDATKFSGMIGHDIENNIYYFSDGVSWQPAANWADSTGTALVLPSGGTQYVQGVPFRASRHSNVYGNAGIIDRMQADVELWRMWCFGDSRTAGSITSKFAVRAPVGIPLAGIEQATNNNTITGWDSSQVTPAGDAIPSSPYLSYAPDPITYLEVRTVGGATTGAANTLGQRLTYAGTTYTWSSIAALSPRLPLRPVRVKTLVRAASTAWSRSTTLPIDATPSMPNIMLQLRPNGTSSSGDTGYLVSDSLPIYTPGEPMYSVAGLTVPAGSSWSTYNDCDVSHITDPAITIGTDDRVASFSRPWFELPTGILFHEVGCVAGRSIAALLNPEVTPDITFSQAIPACAGKHALWLAIGTNNPASQTATTFLHSLMTLIERFRAGVRDPSAPVVLVTSYAADSDAGVAPYYVTASRTLAGIDRNVVCIDTYAELPNYADGVTLGYYSDVTHYNATGQNAYGDAFWDLWLAA